MVKKNTAITALIFNFLLLLFFSINLFAQGINWATETWGASNAPHGKISVDRFGNSYVSAPYYKWDDTINGVILNGKGHPNSFIAKYNNKGEFIWASTSNSEDFHGHALSYTVEHDVWGNAYMAGYFREQIEFDGVRLNPSSIFANGFVTKYDHSGNVLWVFHLESLKGSAFVNHIKVDIDGNCYVLGSGKFPIRINSTEIHNQPSQNSNSFISKLNPNGEIIWNLTGIGSSPYWRMEFVQDGDLILVGDYQNYVIWNDETFPSSRFGSTLIARINKVGYFEWIKTIHSKAYNQLFDLKLDREDNAYLIGKFGDSLAIGEAPYYSLMKPPFDRNISLIKFSKNGLFEWSYEFDTEVYDKEPNRLIIDYNNNLYAFGTKNIIVDTSPRNVVSKYGIDKQTGELIETDYILNLSSYLDIGVDFWGNFYTYSSKYSVNQDENGIKVSEGKRSYVVCIGNESKSNKESSELYVFPNPTSKMLQIRIFDFDMLPFNSSIYDLNGKKIKSQIISTQEARIELEEFSPGIYTIVLRNQTKELTSKFIVTKRE